MGRGWQRGDKTDVQTKPQAFVDKGFVFVSTNYRFVPKLPDAKRMAGVASTHQLSLALRRVVRVLRDDFEAKRRARR